MDLIARGDKAINERYRPMRFSEIIGCESIKKALTKWMSLGEKRSKSLLLNGFSGSGKTTMGRILAMGLNCEKNGDTVEPCLECPSCKAAMNGEAMHISEYNMSALTGKDDAEQIVLSMQNSCFTGRNRVFIFDESQGMSTASQNLLLKTLENPPSNTYIFLLTTNPEKLLKTVKNRCEQYEFKLPTLNDIKTMLGTIVRQEMPDMKLEQRKEILDACVGLSYREILMKLEKFMNGGGTESIAETFQTDYIKFAKIVMNGDFTTAMETIDKTENFDVEAARRVLRTFLCNQVVYNAMNTKSKKYHDAFRCFDKGFYTDPNPMPSFKMDVWEAMNILLKG